MKHVETGHRRAFQISRIAFAAGLFLLIVGDAHAAEMRNVNGYVVDETGTRSRMRTSLSSGRRTDRSVTRAASPTISTRLKDGGHSRPISGRCFRWETSKDRPRRGLTAGSR